MRTAPDVPPDDTARDGGVVPEKGDWVLAIRTLGARLSGAVARPVTFGGGNLTGSAREGPARTAGTTAAAFVRAAAPVSAAAAAGQEPDGFDVRSAYRAHGSTLYGFVLNALGDRGLAEDCVQETFLRAWRARDGFDAARGSERTWLFAIARNVVIDAARARTRRLRLVTDEGAALDRVLAAAAAPGDLAEDLAVRIQVSDALSRLSEDHRTVVVEVQLRGRSYDDLATALDVSVGTLRSRMFYGLRALRSALEEAGWTHAR
jgi:RNA polymerase sigma-70 factor (ECF subfamily)